MSEGEFKKRILEHGKNYGYRDFREAIVSWVNEARKDFPCYECNLRCVFCGRECNEFKKWFVKWIGEKNE